MRELFFSLVSRELFIAILEDSKIIKTIHEDNHQMHSENFVSKLGKVFNNISFSPSQLNKIFFLTGPGGQTGERVSLSFAIASLLSNPNVGLFSISSLEFQAAFLQECLSAISVGEKSRRYYFTVYQNGEVLSKGEKIEEEEFIRIKKLFWSLPVRIDFEKIDFLGNFLACKKNFRVFKNQLN